MLNTQTFLKFWDLYKNSSDFFLFFDHVSVLCDQIMFVYYILWIVSVWYDPVYYVTILVYYMIMLVYYVF